MLNVLGALVAFGRFAKLSRGIYELLEQSYILFTQIQYILCTSHANFLNFAELQEHGTLSNSGVRCFWIVSLYVLILKAEVFKFSGRTILFSLQLFVLFILCNFMSASCSYSSSGATT